ncbi:C protein alpha-antigen precursor [Corynebacterium cystitidis DSM 20524]|uniref:Rib/alpha-like domain-containing protein n=1 Tax=Corynebacterium cystitidis TaxID=35757 RepID=UPI0025B59271|nr:Rib/alpha-like domain-containing protein [Corynebacterium cystitidis]WJY83601.1 C protein alpha-antigen precursor [Corynebacterium cystitidis DSM 20524]
MHMKSIARRRGTTIAAAALSVALVAPMVQPVVTPQTLAKAQAITNNKPADANWTAPAGTIDADGIKNGYVQNASALDTSKHIISGAVGIMETTAPGSLYGKGGLNGVTVLMQWRDKDGSISPVYAAQSQGHGTQRFGTGSFVFDLREPWVDVNGKEHLFDSTGTGSDQQAYRLWVADSDMVNPETGNRLHCTRQVSGLVPGSWTGVAPGSGHYPADASGATQVAGRNIAYTGVFLTEQAPPAAKKSYMAAPEITLDEQGPISNPAVTLREKNTVSGRVWLESTQGDRVVGPVGENRYDKHLKDYNVYLSILTEDARIKAQEIEEQYPENERAGKTKEMLENERANGREPIEKTFAAKTDEDGRYSIRTDGLFNNDSYFYMWVENEEGEVVSGYSANPTPVFQRWTENRGENPGIITGYNPSPANLYNRNFAVIPYTVIQLDITNYDSYENPAPLDAVAELEVTGALPPFEGNKIIWRNETTDKIVKECDVTTLADANACTFDTTTDDKREPGTVYSATLHSGLGDFLASDTFTIVDAMNLNNEPSYDPATTSPGAEVEVPQKVSDLPDGTKFEPQAPKNDAGEPQNGWTVAETPSTEDNPGSLTVTPPADTQPGDYTIPVLVTYPDGSKETIDAKVTVTPKQADQFAPSYENKLIVPGTPAESAPKFKNDKGEDVTVPEGAKFEIPGDYQAPQGYDVKIDPDTGVVTVTAPEKLDKDTAEELKVPVKVTYKDGSVDDAIAPFQLDTDGDGTPDVTDEDDDNDGYTDIVENEAGTNPKDPSDKPSLAGQHDPVGQDINTNVGVVPNSDKGIQNLGELPKGTTTKWETEPKVDEPGTVPATIVVTYPDGSKDTVNIKVKVTDPSTDADKHDPVGQDINTNVGVVPNSDKGIQNLGELPKGTTTKWETEPKVDEPGTVPATIVVTYPDGSKDTVNIKVKVTDPSTDADKHDPVGQDINTNVGVVPNSDKGIQNLGELPEGTTTEWETEPKVDEPGTVPATIVVTYPDGSKDTVKVKVNVTDPSTDASKFEPEYRPTDVPVGESRPSNNPFEGTDAPVANVTLGDTSKATNWTFTPDTTSGVITAQAPTLEQLAAQYNGLFPSGSPQTIVGVGSALTNVIKPAVPVVITYQDGSQDAATAVFNLLGKDGKSILDPNGDFDGDGSTNGEEITGGSNPFDPNSTPSKDAPDWNNGTVKPGGTVNLPNVGGKVQEGTTVTVEGPGKGKLNPNGSITVEANKDAKPGDKIKVTVKDKDGKAIDEVAVTVEAPSDHGSSDIDTGRCVATALGFGLPLLALVPIGLASQLSIPGLSPLVGQVNARIQEINTQLQAQVGVLDPKLAAFVADINAALGSVAPQAGKIASGIAIVAAGLLVGSVIYDACSPEDSSTSSSVLGSSGNKATSSQDDK